jgi:urease accessory protein
VLVACCCDTLASPCCLAESAACADLVRTRDPSKLAEADIVLDVGGVYDPSTHRYDHHQRGFEETFSPSHRTKLSSAGLVYKHFGQELIKQEIAGAGSDAEADRTKLDILYRKLYENFVEALDGIDNGIQQYEAEGGVPVKQRYSSRTDLSARVGQVSRARGYPIRC